MPINPNEDLENNHMLYIGKSGSGKTYNLRQHPEVKKRGAQVIVWEPYESHDCHYAKSIPAFGRLLGQAVKCGKGFKID